MKQASAALISYLNSNDQVVLADLYTFVLVGNVGLRYVDYPLSQMVIPTSSLVGSVLNTGGGSVTFFRGPKIGRSKMTAKLGLDPAEVNIDIYPEPTDLIGSISWQEFALNGGFDGGLVELDRLFMPLDQDGVQGPLNLNLGSILWFYGKVADVDVGRTKIEIKAKTYINLLQQQQMPRRLFQTGCTHIFGDPMCGYDRVNGLNALGTPTGVGAGNFTLTGGSSRTVLLTTANPSGNYVQGTAICLTGPNAGISRGILSIAGNVTNLSRGFPFTPGIGDTFQYLPGCDHTSNTCNAVFQNLLRYGGFDYIPPPEISV